jgi:hypothetical protein
VFRRTPHRLPARAAPLPARTETRLQLVAAPPAFFLIAGNALRRRTRTLGISSSVVSKLFSPSKLA